MLRLFASQARRLIQAEAPNTSWDGSRCRSRAPRRSGLAYAVFSA